MQNRGEYSTRILWVLLINMIVIFDPVSPQNTGLFAPGTALGLGGGGGVFSTPSVKLDADFLESYIMMKVQQLQMKS